MLGMEHEPRPRDYATPPAQSRNRWPFFAAAALATTVLPMLMIYRFTRSTNPTPASRTVTPATIPAPTASPARAPS
jgi:hypothetical protein